MSIIDEACLPQEEQANILISGYKFASSREPVYDYELALCY